MNPSEVSRATRAVSSAVKSSDRVNKVCFQCRCFKDRNIPSVPSVKFDSRLLKVVYKELNGCSNRLIKKLLFFR